MSKFDDERRAIEARFGGNYSSTAIQWENIDFPQPDENTSWVALRLISGSGSQVSLGTGNTSRQTRFNGIIQVDIYTPEGTGTKGARDLADVISAIFDGVQFSAGDSGTIYCGVPDYRILGQENGRFRSVVSVAYQRVRFT